MSTFGHGHRQFFVLSAYLGLIFLIGGGARDDVQSLLILRPLSLLVLGYGFSTLARHEIQSSRSLLTFAGIVLILPALYLVPIPPAVWQALPGRSIVAQIDEAAGLGQIWRPLSLAPTATWNAFFSLFVPLSVLVLMIQLPRRQLHLLVYPLIAVGLVSALLSVLQVLGDPRGPLYLYRITNNGSAVGLFSNRNHQAFYLAAMFPLLAVAASFGVRSEDQASARKWVCALLGLSLVPIMLNTGSRTGLALGLAGLVGSWLVYPSHTGLVAAKRRGARRSRAAIALAAGLLAVIALTVLVSRAEGIQRVSEQSQFDDLRFKVWLPIVRLGADYFPFGSGPGSFVPVYRMIEPDTLLRFTYLNHAHNDWLEIWLTAGVPGVLLLGWFLFAYLRDGQAAFRRSCSSDERTFARLGAITVAIFLLGSLTDYPLRTPSLACVFAIALGWLGFGTNRNGWRWSPGLDTDRCDPRANAVR